MLFESTNIDWGREKLLKIQNELVCLEDPAKVYLQGQYVNDKGTFLRMTWEKCTGTTADGRPCKNATEIEEFLHSKFVFMYYNTQSYLEDTYSPGVIQDRLEVERFYLNANIKSLYGMTH